MGDRSFVFNELGSFQIGYSRGSVFCFLADKLGNGKRASLFEGGFWRQDMKSIRNLVKFLGVAVLVAVTPVSRAQATSITVTPPTQTVFEGNPAVNVDIDVSGLTQGVGGYSFTLTWDPTLLTAVNVQEDPGNKMGATANELDLSTFTLPVTTGTLSTLFLGDPGLDNAGLMALQTGGAFTLATVTFAASSTNSGLSPLVLTVAPTTGAFLSAADGVTVIDASAFNGSVCVSGPAPSVPGTNAFVPDPCAVAAVPEPATFGLLATGIATVLARRRRKNQA